jgi:hypothetical protein
MPTRAIPVRRDASASARSASRTSSAVTSGR